MGCGGKFVIAGLIIALSWGLFGGFGLAIGLVVAFVYLCFHD